MCGLHIDGSVNCTGDNRYGQLNPPDGPFKLISAGGNHTCGIRTDGSIDCWGWTSYGQSDPQPHSAEPALVARDFANLAVHWKGSFLLERKVKTVTAKISSVRSPVQYSARQDPEPLFAVPKGFQLATDLQWEVKGWHVTAEGAPDPANPEPRKFTLRVASDGIVSYVDNLQVEGIGYLRFSVSIAWPKEGLKPQLWERSPSVQAALLAALTLHGSDPPNCSDVTWEQLASIRVLGTPLSGSNSMGKVSPMYTDDLAGLSGLEEVHIQVDYSLREGLLAPAPNLQTLALSAGQLYSDYFAHDLSLPNLPADLLVYTPTLTTLKLNTFLLNDFPLDFLALAPELTNLDLWYRFHAVSVGPWPWSGNQPVPENLLAHTPHLNALNLRAGVDVTLPADIFVPFPQLKELGLYLGTASEFPPDLLVPVPELSKIEIDALGTAGPDDFLVDVTDLEILVFNMSELSGLPDGFLALSPQLSSAELNLNGLNSLPTEFLAHAPQLTNLELEAYGLLEFPETFLNEVPKLTKLHL